MMRALRLALVAAALTFASPKRAEAAFLIPIVAAVVGSEIVATIIVTVAAFAANYGVSWALAKLNPPKVDVGGAQLDMRVDGTLPQSFIAGRAVTAGSLAHGETYGKRGKIDNSDCIRIISISDAPVTAISQSYCEDQLVTTQPQVGGDPEKAFSTDAGNRGQLVDGYNFKLAIQFYLGDQTAADPLAVAALGTHPERPWGADKIGRNRAYMREHAIFDQEVLSSLPRWRFVVDGIRLYDPRKDSTVGGSGPHRFGDLATHEFSKNLQLIAYNILRGIRVADADGVPRHLYGLEDTPAANLPLDNWFAAFNEADATIDGEPQYHGGLEIFISDEPLDVVKQIMRACDGRLSEVGGIYKAYVGAPGLPVATIDDGVLRANDGDEFRPVKPLMQRVNYVTATYMEPGDSWNPKVAPPRGDAAMEAADRRRLEADLNLQLVQSARHIQALQQRALDRSKRERAHTIPLPPELFGIEPGDALEWNSDRNDYVEKLFEVDSVSIASNLNSVVTLIEVDHADYDPPVLIDQPSTSLVVDRPAPKVIVGFDVEAILDAGDNGGEVPAFRISWDAPEDGDISALRWQLRLTAQPDDVTSGNSADVAAGAVILRGGLQSLTSYQARVKFESANGYPADWSLWKTVTTLQAQIPGLDLVDGAVTESKLAAAAVTATKLADEAVEETKLATNIAAPIIYATPPSPTGYTGSPVILDQSTGVLKRLVGGAWTDAVAAAAVIGQLVTAQIADAAIVGSKLAAATIDATKLASSIAAVEIFASAPSTGNFAGRQYFNTGDNKVYRYTGSAWTVATDGADIVANSITGGKIAAGAISTTQLAAGAITADKIGAGAIVASKLSVSPALMNLVLNGDFEDATGFLDTWGAAFDNPNAVSYSYALSTAQAHSGTHSIALTRYGACYGKPFPIAAGETLEFSCWMKTDVATPKGVYIGCRQDDASGTPLRYDYILADGAGTTGWVFFSGQLVTVAGAVSIQPSMLHYSTTGAVATVAYFDDYTVRRAVGSTFIQDGAITTNKIVAGAITTSKLAAGAVTANEIAANTITAGKIAAGAIGTTQLAAGAVTANEIAAGAITASKFAVVPASLTINGDFEDGLGGWIGTNPSLLHLNTTNPYTGLKCAQLDYYASGTQLRSGNLSVELNSTYELTAYIRGDVASSAAFYLGIFSWDASGGYISGGDRYVAAAAAVTTSYQKFGGTFTTPLNAASVTVFVWHYSTSTAGYLLIDQVNLRKTIGTTLIEDGAITTAKIVAGAITASKIAAGTITANELAAGAVTASKIAADSISTTHLQVNSVDINKLVTGAATSIDSLGATSLVGSAAPNGTPLLRASDSTAIRLSVTLPKTTKVLVMCVGIVVDTGSAQGGSTPPKCFAQLCRDPTGTPVPKGIVGSYAAVGVSGNWRASCTVVLSYQEVLSAGTYNFGVLFTAGGFTITGTMDIICFQSFN